MRPREGDDGVKTAAARRAGRKGTWTPKTMLGIFRSRGRVACEDGNKTGEHGHLRTTLHTLTAQRVLWSG